MIATPEALRKVRRQYLARGDIDARESHSACEAVGPALEAAADRIEQFESSEMLRGMARTNFALEYVCRALTAKLAEAEQDREVLLLGIKVVTDARDVALARLKEAESERDALQSESLAFRGDAVKRGEERDLYKREWESACARLQEAEHLAWSDH